VGSEGSGKDCGKAGFRRPSAGNYRHLPTLPSRFEDSPVSPLKKRDGRGPGRPRFGPCLNDPDPFGLLATTNPWWADAVLTDLKLLWAERSVRPRNPWFLTVALVRTSRRRRPWTGDRLAGLIGAVKKKKPLGPALRGQLPWTHRGRGPFQGGGRDPPRGGQGAAKPEKPAQGTRAEIHRLQWKIPPRIAFPSPNHRTGSPLGRGQTRAVAGGCSGHRTKPSAGEREPLRPFLGVFTVTPHISQQKNWAWGSTKYPRLFAFDSPMGPQDGKGCQE